MNQGFPCRYGSIPQGKTFNSLLEVLLDVLVAIQKIRKNCLEQRNFKIFSRDLVKKKLYPRKASTFLYFQKEFQNITIKIDNIGTCQNF
jgi:hypothetical protein